MINNIHKHNFEITRNFKEDFLKSKGSILWLSGLSGSGKSTIANELEKLFFKNKFFSTIIDGDTVRSGLCSNLGFSQEDRKENLRRVAEVAKLFTENGIVTICCFISPLSSQREMIKGICGDDFKLIYIKTDLKACEERDPKGLYKKARNGEIKNFTGIDSPYEVPNTPDLVLDSAKHSPKDSAQIIFDFYQNHKRPTSPKNKD